MNRITANSGHSDLTHVPTHRRPLAAQPFACLGESVLPLSPLQCQHWHVPDTAGKSRGGLQSTGIYSRGHTARAEVTPCHLHKHPMALCLLAAGGQEDCCQHWTQHMPVKGNHAHHLYQNADKQKPNQCRDLGIGTPWLSRLSPKATWAWGSRLCCPMPQLLYRRIEHTPYSIPHTVGYEGEWNFCAGGAKIRACWEQTFPRCSSVDTTDLPAVLRG